jgi:hypothetical protein
VTASLEVDDPMGSPSPGGRPVRAVVAAPGAADSVQVGLEVDEPLPSRVVVAAQKQEETPTTVMLEIDDPIWQSD